MSAPWLEPYAARLAALEPLGPGERVAMLDAWARAAGLRTESGHRVRFVPGDAPAAPGTRRAYEARVFETGEVATRTGAGARHDLYNALAWLAWPRTKARLNALHAAALAGAAPGAPRGPLRDAATVFDENAALWIGDDAALESALRAHDWRGLFVTGRARLRASVRVVAFGHALLEKLDAPYKAVTAHAWPLRIAARSSPDAIDAALAASLRPGHLATRAMCPLPVMGLPGWCDRNVDPGFYDDPAVFRPARRPPPAPAGGDAHMPGEATWTC